MAQHPFLQNLLNGQAVEWKPLGEICQISNTGVDKKIHEHENKVRLLNFVDVFKNQYLTNDTPAMITSANDRKVIDCNILQGDIFVTPSSEVIDEIGQSAMAVENIDNAVYSYHIMRLRIHDKSLVYPPFLNYLFQSDDLRRQIRANAQGMTRFGLTQPKWKALQIPIPPLSVQTKIVQILDAFTAITAELTAELSMRNKQYQYYRDKLLSENELVKVGFEWKTLGEVGELIRGNGLTKKDLLDDGVPAIHYGQIYTYYRTETIKTISFVSKELAKKLRKVDCGDVVITNTSENFDDVGKALLYLGTEQAVTGGHATIFKPSQAILGKYFVYFTQSKYFSNEKRKYAKGTKVIDVSAADMAKIQIPIPPLAEQARIVAILDKFDTLTRSISDGLPREIELRQQQYAYYREALLSF